MILLEAMMFSTKSDLPLNGVPIDGVDSPTAFAIRPPISPLYIE
jgi:hypothetical protein